MNRPLKPIGCNSRWCGDPSCFVCSRLPTYQAPAGRSAGMTGYLRRVGLTGSSHARAGDQLQIYEGRSLSGRRPSRLPCRFAADDRVLDRAALADAAGKEPTRPYAATKPRSWPRALNERADPGQTGSAHRCRRRSAPRQARACPHPALGDGGATKWLKPQLARAGDETPAGGDWHQHRNPARAPKRPPAFGSPRVSSAGSTSYGP